MAVIPAGPISLPLKYLRASIAGSAKFRSVTGAANATLAEAFIYPGEVPATVSRPYAIINLRDPMGRLEGGQQWRVSGTLEVDFEFPTPAEYASSLDEARWDFWNSLGTILQEMTALAKTAGYLTITQVRTKIVGRADPVKNQGAAFWVANCWITFEGQWNA